MISLAKVLSGKPILLSDGVYFHQPTLQDVEDMGEDIYWQVVNLWQLKRKDLVPEENEYSIKMSDFELWKTTVLLSDELKRVFILSCAVLLKTKVEFFELTSTIYIGEKASGVFLDEAFYKLMQALCQRITTVPSASEETAQYRETDNMSERERQLIAKIKAAQQKLESAKSGSIKPEDFLGDRILGLVAVGHYTFEQVYSMTMLQFNMLLQKYVDIQSFELRTLLSPYMSSENESQNENKFWLSQ